MDKHNKNHKNKAKGGIPLLAPQPGLPGSLEHIGGKAEEPATPAHKSKPTKGKHK